MREKIREPLDHTLLSTHVFLYLSPTHLELLVVSGDRLGELDLLPLADEGLEERLLVQADVVGVEVSVEGVRPALLPLEEDVCEKLK